MALDQPTIDLLAALSAAGLPPIHQMTPGEARAHLARLRQSGDKPKVARTEDVRIEASGPAGGTFAARVIVPEGEVRAVLVWMHGGGWVFGSIEDSDVVVRTMARRLRCAIVNVDYRLAPEHRFPTAVDDADAALVWAAGNVERIAGKKVPLLVGGDSAGGNLATVIARRARDRGGPAIALQILVYPATDTDLARPAYHAPENQQFLTGAAMTWFWNHYAPDVADRQHPDAAPLKAASLRGLPPALVLLAEHDPLREEGEQYAAALIRADVPVTCRRLDGQMHGFFGMGSALPGARLGLEIVARAVDAELAELSTLTA
jgi:acetyl esterase